mmetsp:Transcript_10585/g.13861  ORF Transcript_10585/g.13861 Transcript_10585/m.13861 type:complete len:91 (-) Transcript_10585:194-466(-)
MQCTNHHPHLDQHSHIDNDETGKQQNEFEFNNAIFDKIMNRLDKLDNKQKVKEQYDFIKKVIERMCLPYLDINITEEISQPHCSSFYNSG